MLVKYPGLMFKSKDETLSEDLSCGSVVEDGNDVNDLSQLPSLHEMRQRASVTAWSRIRSCMLDMCVRNNIMPHGQACTFCFVAKAEFRCLRCGPYSYYCMKCLELHSLRSVYHLPEIWKVQC